MRWAMLVAGAVLRERLIFDRSGLVGKLVPATDEQLRQELARTIRRYLDAAPE